jgi:PAS domain S-box-containing protein
MSRSGNGDDISPEQGQKLLLGVRPDVSARLTGAETFRLSVDLLPEPALIFSIDGTILRVNTPAVKLLEADSHEELIGRNIYSLCSMTREKIRDAAAQLAGGAAIHFELDFLTLKRSRRRIDLIEMPMMTATGEVECVIGFARDISDLEHGESDYTLMAAIVDSSDDAIISTALAGTITSWNRRAEEMFGFTQREAIGQPFLIIVPPARRTSAVAMVEEVVANRSRNISYDGPALRKDSSVVEISITLFGIYGHRKQLLGLSYIMRDDTERKRAERERGMLAAIVDSSEDAIFTAASDRTIRTWNLGAEKLYGYSAREVIGKPLTILLPPERREEFESLFDKVLLGAAIRQYETKRMRKDGTLFDVSVSDSPVRDPAWMIVGVAAIARDITERKSSERENGMLAAIVKASQDAIINVSPEGTILNAAFAGAPALSTTFPSTDLGTQLQQIAQIIQVRATLGASNQIFFASLGGFDTHVDELNGQSGPLTQLSQAVNAFYDATVELGVADAVTTFTQSDFSRTLQPNTKGGSDHAWGNRQIVLGGAVKAAIFTGPSRRLRSADRTTRSIVECGFRPPRSINTPPRWRAGSG